MKVCACILAGTKACENCQNGVSSSQTYFTSTKIPKSKKKNNVFSTYIILS